MSASNDIENVLRHADEERVEALSRLASERADIDPLSALDAASEALQIIGERADFLSQKADILHAMGIAYRRLSDYDNASAHAAQALKLYQTIGSAQKASNALSNLGIIEEAIANYPRALSYHQESLRLRIVLNDKQGICRSLNNIGNIHALLKNPAKALEYYKESLATSHEIQDRYSAACTLGNIGNVYESLADYRSALTYHRECLAAWQELGNNYAISYALNNIGAVHYSLGEHNAALQSHAAALERQRQLGDSYGVVHSLTGMAKSLLSLKRYAEAETTLKEACAVAKDVGLKQNRCDVLHSLASLYAQTGRFEDAYSTHMLFYEEERAIFNEENQKQIAMMEARFQTEVAQKEAELERVRNVELTSALREVELQKRNAEEANAFKTELLGIAAHDLKNPLQAISGFAALIQESKTLDEARNYAAIIQHSSERMFQLIRELLETTALDARKLTLRLFPLDVADLLRAVAAHSQHNAENKSQTIELALSMGCVANVDAERMLAVFDNLLSNAIKYSPVGKKIVVRCQKRQAKREFLSASGEQKNDALSSRDVILVSVQDEGQGLTPEDKTKLFGKFQRLSARPTGNESSTGLGLSIVKQLVELHGGTVWAESEGQGKGTTFFVELPAL